MSPESSSEYVLGIDLGTNSLGWAIIALVDGEPHHLLRAGARVFEAGMEGNLASGREESRNLKRRQMRLQRRQTWRRSRRLRKIFNLLQRHGLLPPGGISSAEERQDFLNRLDENIRASAWFKNKIQSGAYPEPAQVMPYILRSAALDGKLEPYFLGRALYHLAQRRGFLSNRKQIPKKGDDDGVVKEGIVELRRLMQESRARTLGEYFSRVAPSQERIRCRWTARDMYQSEFEGIWQEQAKYWPDLLTQARKKDLRQATFFQRPLWFDRNTIGRCELEPSQRRAPAYLLSSQRFRLLQAVNNLAVLPPGEIETLLTAADRQKLIEALESKGDLKFDKVRQHLGLTKEYRFNLERGGEKSIRGNRTNAQFLDVFGERWLSMPPDERDRAVEYVRSFERPIKLSQASKTHFGLDDEAARKLSEIVLEPDYMNHSRRAIDKFLPWLERGLTYAEARKLAYPDSFRPSRPAEFLPAVDRALSDIRNPAVMRSLTELRKVVNAIVRQHGKPAFIRIELARDLKKSKKQRAALTESNRRNEKSRAEAAKEIIKAQVGINQPKPDDIRKWLLAEECQWQCPYTGRTITPKSLFGPEAQFDIEHIIPFSRSMDNSFQNLTLCYVPENRNLKGNKTPHQAYSGGSERYDAILDRVRQFTGERTMVVAKLRRFAMKDEELEKFLEDFRTRQLNDTAYATVLAARYLGALYGGMDDAHGEKRIQATSGQATHYFRSLWNLNSILSDGLSIEGGNNRKSREDHRHHAIDAVVIGLTDAGMIKRLADAAERAPLEHHRRFASLEAPWHNFVDSVRTQVDGIVVSHRVSRRVSGPLHEETIYSFPAAGGRVGIRKHLANLSKTEIEEIADPRVKGLVSTKLRDGDPTKVFAHPEGLPSFHTTDGRKIPIKHVRLRKAVPTFALRQGRSSRHVANGSNHHIEIYTELDSNGNEGKWDAEVVPLFEAFRRLKSHRPIVQTDHGPLAKFKFSLAPGEAVECDVGKGERGLFILRKMSQYTSGSIVIGFAPHGDARRAQEIQASRAWLWSSPHKLRDQNARKVVVSPLGEVSEAHD